MVSDSKTEVGNVLVVSVGREYDCLIRMPAGLDLLSPGGEGGFSATRDATFTAEYFRFIIKEMTFSVKPRPDKLQRFASSLLHIQTKLFDNPLRSTHPAEPLCVSSDVPPHLQCSRH